MGQKVFNSEFPTWRGFSDTERHELRA